MTKTEMVKKLAETWGETSNRGAADKLDSFVEFITKTVKKDKELKIPNLGTFRLRQLKARMGRNPQTGEAIKISARKKVAFTPAKVFKESILGPAKTAVAKKTAPKKVARKKQSA
jgi:DNA-binding protein HU-beta